MESDGNYGLILWHLRQQAKLSVRKMSKKIGRSTGWLSEIENSRGTARLPMSEFERIVKLLDGDQHREMFRTWVANHKNNERADRTFDGAVLKFIRLKRQLSLSKAAAKAGLSVGYLSKIESGFKPVTMEVRKRLMLAYGYSPSSFKNLSTDPVRSKAVPLAFKLRILITHMQEQQIDSLYHFAKSLTENVRQNVSCS